MGSQFRQALVARRQQSHSYSASTVVDVDPQHFQQSAGLICYYNSAKFHYLHVSHDARVGKYLRVMSCVPDQVQSDAFTNPIPIPAGPPIHLRVEVDCERLQFAYRRTARTGTGCRSSSTPASFRMKRPLQASPTSPARSSGVLPGSRRHEMPADFDYFEYPDRPFRSRPFGAGD